MIMLIKMPYKEAPHVAVKGYNGCFQYVYVSKYKQQIKFD